jgi:hypothetical protein
MIKEVRMKKIKLKEMMNKFSIGIYENGEFKRDFEANELTGRQVEELGNPKFRKSPQLALTNLMKGSIKKIGEDDATNKNLDFFKKLSKIDREIFILDQLMLGGDDELTQEKECPVCNFKNKIVQKIEEIEVDVPDEDDFIITENESGNSILCIKVMLGEKELLFRVPDGKTEEILSNESENNIIRLSNLILEKCIVTKDVNIKNLKNSQIKQLRKDFSEALPVLNLPYTYNCQNCNSELQVDWNLINFLIL